MNWSTIIRRSGQVTVAAVFALAPAAASGVPALAGHWVGEWVRDGAALDVWCDFTSGDSTCSGSFGSNGLRVLDVPFRQVHVDSSGVHWEIVGDETISRFDGVLANDRLSGTFTDARASGTFDLHRTHEPTRPPYSVEEVHFGNGDVSLAGSLLMPAGSDRHPAIVFVHGSGGEGRHASRYLADRFARAGFAALVYDKRGVGGSGGDWKRATFDDLAGDAVAAIRMLAADRRIRASAIGIHGHSQGGTIAPLIASRWPGLGFVIASSAGGVPPSDAELYSYRNYLGVPRMHGADSLRAMAYLSLVVRVGYGGEPWARADSAGRANAGEKWFAGIPDSTDSFWWLAPRIARYDPAVYWRRVKAPVLLVYGERDERVPVQASLRRIQAALRAAGNTAVTSRTFPATDHTFRIPASPDGKFHWPQTPDGYPQLLIDWARAQTGMR